MEKKDYIPSNDEEFNNLQNNVCSAAKENMVAWLIPLEVIGELTVPQGRWAAALSMYRDPATRTPAVTREKNDAKKAYTVVMRPFIQGQLMHNSRVSDADRIMMGLPVYDRTPTRPPVPTSRPELGVDFSQFTQHRISAHDSETKSAGKPDHVLGFELWRKIGGTTEPSFEDMELVGLVTRTPYVVEYASVFRGEMAWYLGRWVNTRGEHGPKSEIISAIIP